MRKILLLIFLINFINNKSFSQESLQNRIESKIHILNNKPASIQKVNLMNELVDLYWKEDNRQTNDSIKLFTLAAIELSRKLNYPKGLATSLYNIGKYNITTKDNFAESTPCFLESLANYDILKDSSGISKCYLQLGLTSYILEYYEDAVKNFNLSLNYQKNSTANYLMALSYSELDSFNKARLFFNLALNNFRNKNDEASINDCYMYLGKLFLKMNTVDSSFYYLNLVINKMEKLNDTNTLNRPYAFLARAYYQKKKVDKAIYYGDKSYHLTLTHPDRISLMEASSVLSEAYAMKGDYKKAYQFNYILKKTNDSFFKGSMKQKVADMRSTYDFKKKINDQKILRLKDEQIADEKIQKEKILRNSFLCGSALLLIMLGGLYNRYVFKQKSNLALQNRNEIISKEKERSDELLLNILPEEVAEELKNKGSAAAKQFESVTVMFTDFQDFTKISEKLTPEELVAEIDWCYKAFDKIITKNNLEKIKTIGDSYMCGGGLPVANLTHAIDIVNAAIEIQEYMQNHLEERIKMGKDPFKIRIGIHTGPVVAGIVGLIKFAYDIWGDTVNIASRMESSGKAGEINISGNTYEMVKGHFHCKYRGKIEAKNKGEVDMYFVMGKIDHGKTNQVLT